MTNRLTLASGSTFSIGAGSSATTVFGTDGVQNLTIAAGASVTLDASFNKGGDTITLAGNASSYTVTKSGSSVILTDATGSITIPVGVIGMNIAFADAAARSLVSTTAGAFTLGGQAVSETAAAVTAGTVATAGSTFTLTTGINRGAAFTGTAGDDLFEADETTLTAGDSLVGGAGDDTLSLAIVTAAANIGAGAASSGIENLAVSNVDNAAASVDAQLLAGLELVTVTGGRGDVEVNNLGRIVDAGLTSTNADLTLVSTAAAVAGTSDEVVVVVNATALTADVTVTYDGIETVNLNVAGTSGAFDGATVDNTVTIDSDTLQTLNVTGDGNINVTASFVGAVAEAQTATFDASEAEGAVTASITKGTSSSVSVTMSDQNDFLNYLSALARQATLVGGTGTDTLRLTSDVTFSTTATTAADASGVSGFEALRLANNVDVDNRALTNNSGITTVVAEANGSFTRSAISSLTQLGTGTFTASKATDGAADALALTLTGAGVASTLVAADMETITVVSGGLAANTLTMSAAGALDLTSLTVSGTRSLTATIGGVSLATVNASALSGLSQSFTLDASASTANMTVTGASVTPVNETTTANTITTGDGDDTITTGAGQDVITAGDGDNVVNAGDGSNTVTTGRNADSITTGAGADNISSGLGNDTLVSGGGNDTIDASNGNDSISAGDGDDRITLGTGDDTVDAGAGTDAIINTDYDDDDVIIGGAGSDTYSATVLATLTTAQQVQAVTVFVDVDIDTSLVATPQISGVETVYIQATLAAGNDEATAATNESIDFSATSGMTTLFLETAHNNGAGTNLAKLTLSDVGATTINLLDRETTDSLGELVVEGAGQASLTLRGHDFDGGTDLTVSDVDAVTFTAFTPTTTAAVGDTSYGDVEADDSETVTVSIAGVSALVTAPTLTLASLSADSAIALNLSAGSNSDLDITTNVTSSSEALDTMTITVSDDGEVNIGGDIVVEDAEMSSATITVGVGGLFSVGDDILIESIDSLTVSVAAAGTFSLNQLGAGGAAATITGAAGSVVDVDIYGLATTEGSYTVTGRGDLTSTFAIAGETSVNLSGWTDVNATAWTVTSGNEGVSFTSSNIAANFTGGTGADSAVGGAGSDTLAGGDGADTLSGGAGTDTITGGAGVDVINGGTGADTLVFAAGDSSVTTTTTAAAGFDSVTFGATDVVEVTAVVVETLAAQTAFAATSAGATGTALLTALSTAFAANDAGAAGEEAMLLTFGAADANFASRSFLVVDLDASDTITAADLVIEIIGLTATSTITVAAGEITFG